MLKDVKSNFQAITPGGCSRFVNYNWILNTINDVI